jgi:hypothetical protein
MVLRPRASRPRASNSSSVVSASNANRAFFTRPQLSNRTRPGATQLSAALHSSSV